ncbi:hypothetical protein BGZ59_003966 [Podila verticillata]|nr:hypothetical protein BGZ59_003966 [Podila verticillata]
MPDFNKKVVGTAVVGAVGASYISKKRKQDPTRGPWNASVDNMAHYDYVILGGGTAGCVLANRLTEDPSINVLILEAGYSDDISKSMTPLMLSSCWHKEIDWNLTSVPQVHAYGRVMRQPRGKLLGGSSSINAMMYHRGPASDYDEWEMLGNPGWSYKECLYYFKKAEGFNDPNLPVGHPKGPLTNRIRKPQYETFEPEFHGTEGPWQITYHHLFDSTEAFIRASVAEGVPFNKDFNGSSTLGVNRVQTFIDRHAVRSSASRAYLGPDQLLKDAKPRQDRGHVRIVYGAKIVRVLIQKRKGVKVAIGAEFLDTNHRECENNLSLNAFTCAEIQRVMAVREVLLCAGSFGSPHILLASGIGPKAHPTIPHIHTMAGVGQNLQDHIGVPITFRCNSNAHTAIARGHWYQIPGVIYDYKVNGVGVLTSQASESACFVRLEDVAPEFVAREKANGTWQDRSSGPRSPHFEVIFCPTYVLHHGTIPAPDGQNYFTLSGLLLNPISSGQVTISDVVQDGKLETLIDPNYFSDPFDVRVMTEVMRFIRRIGAHMGRDPTCGPVVEAFPGEDKVPNEDEAAMQEYVKRESSAFYHPTSTCHMGPASDPLAVVDARLNVYGIDRLRVVDASVMPKLPAAHTCAPTIMIAEKAADMIREDWKEPIAEVVIAKL